MNDSSFMLYLEHALAVIGLVYLIANAKNFIRFLLALPGMILYWLIFRKSNM